MQKYILMLFACSVLLAGCATKKNPVDYVDPLIGTGAHGHTYPGATIPFGMVQLSPDTRIDSWDGCSGYHYSDSTILGFSHTHLSGTGVGDYGDIRLMPTIGDVLFNPGTESDPESGYRSRFSHDNEIANAGFYSVILEDYDIKAELTVGERTGYHKYTFPKSQKSNVIIDLTESVTSDVINELGLRLINDTTIAGYRKTQGWAYDQWIYFYAVFSKPFDEATFKYGDQLVEASNEIIKAKDLKVAVSFKTEDQEEVFVKVGISATSIQGAKKNLEAEKLIDFETSKVEARQLWARSLDRIKVEGGSEADLTKFYTAYYHSLLAPNLFSDADGSYRGHDAKVHRSNKKMYTVFSLWDTFRGLHPLLTITEQEKTREFISSMLDMHEKGGLLPVWELAGNETNCMIGYHSIPVIYDAINKGVYAKDDIELQKQALEAMLSSARHDQFGLKHYRKEGYVPAGKEGEAVSKTLEYAYDDWCIAQLAKSIGENEIYNEFIERAQFWKNIFDRENGFVRGRMNGEFVKPFDPTEVNFMLTEANTWQYNFFMPHDVSALIDYLGGELSFIEKLDELFYTEAVLSGRHQSDITGLIGQYAHGNEPSHHMAYLYNYAGAPWKGAEIIRRVLDELYTEKPDGLCGNEDCGQMSAWYVLSSMGFYPVCPGDNIYVIGTPIFDNITIELESGKQFAINATGLSKDNIYIQSIKHNGVDYPYSYITHQMIEEGGEIEFVMGSKPSNWGVDKSAWPKSEIKDDIITETPYFESTSKTFTKDHKVEILSINCEAEIYYTLDGSIPTTESKSYLKPLKLTKSSKIKAIAVVNNVTSRVVEAEYLKIPGGRSIDIKNAYSSQYTAGGDIGLIDFIRGGEDFRTGSWQGYYGVDFQVVIDLGKKQNINSVSGGFLQEQKSWIWMPRYVEILISDDGRNYTKLGKIENDIEDKAQGGITREFGLSKLNQKARFVKVFAKSIEVCPEWHVGAGNKAWIFVDEITIK